MTSSLRTHLSTILFIVIAGIGWFGYSTSKTYSRLTLAQDQVAGSLDVRTAVLFLDVENYNVKTRDKLIRMRRDLATDPRAPILSDVIQAYNEKDRPSLKKRIAKYLETEKQPYYGELIRLRDLEQDLKFNAIAALLFPLLGLTLMIMIIRTKIFRSIDRLSRRMMDFLVDRYSFQFSTPENNELGALQRTFNSLAQRVINNMDELKSLDQAKSEFLSITSHELRTPMTSIKGSLSLLTSGVMGPLDPQAERLLKIAESETDRLIRLINDLLDLAKIEAGKLPLACNWILWDEMIQKTAQGLLGLAQTARVNIAAQTDSGLEVFMDRDRMQQILTNLISNAIKFSPENGTVSIYATKTKNNELLIQVKDQGCGIAPEDQELIFQKFRQGSSPENPIVKGTGLGLAIARALVEEHGGTIGVHSEKGNGATFYFTLPKWRDATGAGSVPDPRDAMPRKIAAGNQGAA